MGSVPILIRTTPEALLVICDQWLPQKIMYVRTDGSVAFGDRRILRLVLPDGREVPLEGQAVQIKVDERGQHVGFRLTSLTPDDVALLNEACGPPAPAAAPSASAPRSLPPPILTEEARRLRDRMERDFRELRVPDHLAGERRRTAILRPALEALESSSRPEVLKELLVETLVRLPASSAAERVQLEAEFAARLSRGPLVSACRLLSFELPALLQAAGAAETRRLEATVRLIALVCNVQSGRIDDPVIALLRTLEGRGEAVARLFPPEIRDWIEVSPFLGETAAQLDEELGAFDAIADPTEYHERAALLARAAECMLGKGLWEGLATVIGRLETHRVALASPFDTRSAIAASHLDRFCSGDRLKDLARALGSAPSRQERELVAGVLRAVGAPAMVEVIEILKRSGDRGVRHSAVQILQESGAAAREAVIRALAEPEQEWFVTRNLVALIGDLGIPSDAAHITRFASHPHEQVRRDCLEAIARLAGAASEKLLLKALDDPSRAVQVRATRLLGRAGAKSEAALRYLRDILEDEEVPERDLDLVLAAIEAFAHLGNVQLPKGGTSEELVEKVLRRSGRVGLRGLLASAGAIWRTDEVRGALCGTLGKIGTPKVERTLRKIAYDKNDPVNTRAEAALFEIAERTRQ